MKSIVIEHFNAVPGYHKTNGEVECKISLRYRAGQGRFSLARPRPYTGLAGYLSRNTRSTPVGGPPALIP